MQFYWLSKVVYFIAFCVWGRGSMCECMCACLTLFLRIGYFVAFSHTDRCLLHSLILWDACSIQWYCQMLTELSDSDGYLLNSVILMDTCSIQWYCQMLTEFSDTEGCSLHRTVLAVTVVLRNTAFNYTWFFENIVQEYLHGRFSFLPSVTHSRCHKMMLSAPVDILASFCLFKKKIVENKLLGIIQ